jgi:hypothetical protein
VAISKRRAERAPPLIADVRWHRIPMASAALKLKVADGPLERELFALNASTPADVTAALRPGFGHFAMFLAWDAASIATDVISTLAAHMHDRGLAYLCAWGPGCERVHDIFDEVEVELMEARPADSVIMTTWHSAEPIEEALWFFVNNSFPDPAYEETCRLGIAATIANDSWASLVDRYLDDLRLLNKAVGV